MVALVACGDDDPAAPTGGVTPLAIGNFADADVVIGQTGMTAQSPNAGSTVNAIGLDDPYGNPDAAPNGTFYLPDPSNNRVLGYTGVPGVNGRTATFVMGQSGFVFSTSGLAANKFAFPVDCTVAGGKLFVVDQSNRRVLIWNSLPMSNQPADVVVGQLNMTVNLAATTQSGLTQPARVAVASGKLFIADAADNRVLIWNSIPTANGAPASVVVGQGDFTGNTSSLSASTFGDPRGLWTDGNKLVITDNVNDRVLIWNRIPTSNGAPADVVVGAPDFATQGSSTPGATSIGGPTGVTADGVNLYVCDQSWHRVLIYKPMPTANGASATGILGQSDFVHFAGNDGNQDGAPDATASAHSFALPTSVTVVGRQLLVTDLYNHRVLVFDGE
jgi:hypothetical protein